MIAKRASQRLQRQVPIDENFKSEMQKLWIKKRGFAGRDPGGNELDTIWNNCKQLSDDVKRSILSDVDEWYWNEYDLKK